MSAKIKKSLIILLAVLIVLIAAVALLLIIPKLVAKDDTGTASPVITVEDPVKVAFGPAGNVTEYVLKDGIWAYSGDTSWPIKQTGVTRILNLLPDVIPVKTIEAADSLSAYGLDPAAYSLTVTGSDGTSQTLYMGNAAADLGSYGMTDTSAEVFIISKDSNIVSFTASTLMDMLDPEIPASMGESAISEMTVTLDGKSASFKQIEDEGWLFLDESGNFIPEEDFSAVGSDGESHTVRKYLNDVGDAVSSFKSRGCMGYDCTAAELSEMGFDTPLVVDVLKTDGTEVVYYVGACFTHTDGAEYHYFTTENNPAVLRMPASAVAPFIELITVLGR